LELVWRELNNLAANPITPRALAAAKKQYVGQMLVASESLEQTILSAGRSLLLTDEIHTSKEVEEAINRVTVEDVARVADMLRQERCSVLSLG
jgi:predicted Zn-dependent peptidase